MPLRAASVFSVSALLLACGGSVGQDAGTGGSNPGGAAGVGGAVGGAAGFGGSTGGSAGSAGSGTCTRTTDHFSAQIAPAWGEPASCAPGGPAADWTGIGAVVKSAPTALVIDQCPPNADCMPGLTSIEIAAAGLSLMIPVGAFVEVRHEVAPAWGSCSERMSIRSVKDWGGVPNPVSDGNWIYLLATDGTFQALPDSPFSVSAKALGCGGGGPGCGGDPPDDYALVFNVGPGDPGTTVHMGETVGMSAGSGFFLVRNQRSFQTAYCDDYWNWSWWATQVHPEK